ncbi:MAG: sugar phosphate isomerase/epimerase family protein [Candidatus Helarchaeota archaeon]
MKYFNIVNKFSNFIIIYERSRSNKPITDIQTDFIQKPLDYKGIELAILEPEKVPVEKISEIADSYKMEIPALGTGSTFLRFGYSLGDINPTVREKAIERLKKYIDFAKISNSKIIIGLIRGRRSYENNIETEKQNIEESLKKCSKLAEDDNIEF